MFYLVQVNMKIIFTGAKTTNDQCFNCLVDGELIYHDKKGNFINLYAAFDIYYYKKEDVRKNTFMLLDSEEDIYKSRYYLLKHFVKTLKPVSIIFYKKGSISCQNKNLDCQKMNKLTI